jgi:hypothetical protein
MAHTCEIWTGDGNKLIILSRVTVTNTRVWIDNWIYGVLKGRHYKQL